MLDGITASRVTTPRLTAQVLTVESPAEFAAVLHKGLARA